MKTMRSGQIKNKKRVNDFGEVFTAEREVKSMCDLIPDWNGNVLEPACGNGNFLLEVLKRKIEFGIDPLQAASEIYGVDIQEDNVQEAIDRLCEIVPNARNIFKKNIVCGDFLKPETVWFLSNREDEN